MIVHRTPADAPWLFLNATHDFIASVAFKEWRETPGASSRLETVELLAVEAPGLPQAVAEAERLAAEDGRDFTLSTYRTWPIVAPSRLAGKRENGRIS